MSDHVTIDGVPVDQLEIVRLLREMNKTLSRILEQLEAKWGPVFRG